MKTEFSKSTMSEPHSVFYNGKRKVAYESIYEPYPASSEYKIKKECLADTLK